MSNETKHTPGPWLYHLNTGNGHEKRPFLSLKGNVSKYADFHDAPWIGDLNCDGFSRTEEHANARLIAAAPDLLAACEAAVAYMGPQSPTTEVIDVFRQLCAAIEKARSGEGREIGR